MDKVNQLSKLFLELKFVKHEFGLKLEFKKLEFQSVLVHTARNLSSKNNLLNLLTSIACYSPKKFLKWYYSTNFVQPLDFIEFDIQVSFKNQISIKLLFPNFLIGLYFGASTHQLRRSSKSNMQRTALHIGISIGKFCEQTCEFLSFVFSLLHCLDLCTYCMIGFDNFNFYQMVIF